MRLPCFGKLSVSLNFLPFASDALAVLGGLLNQVECPGGKAEFPLRKRQAAFGCSHCVNSFQAVCASFLTRHHYGYGRSRVVNVQRAACGNQFHQLGAVVVVADIEREMQAVLVGLRFVNGKA